MFQLDNARQGFVEEGQFDRMADEAAKEGLWLRLLIEVAYTIGWRRGELLELRVRQIDLRKCVLRLDPGTTKNKKGREVQLDEQKQSSLLEFLRNACDGKKAEDYVFTRKVDDKQIP